jgi:rhamnosyltransferase
LTAEVAKILATVVTYYPDGENLLALVEELCDQVSEVLIVDNTPANNDIVWEVILDSTSRFHKLRVVRLGDNLGIAAALNVGIKVAIDEDFSHVLLSDQDSLPVSGMVDGLLQAEKVVSASGKKIGAVGPVYVDKTTDFRFTFQVQKHEDFFYSHSHVSEALPDLEVLSLISSGSLINTQVLQIVGGMQESLFIDSVDVEWCHRANSMGYVHIGTIRGLMIHNLGENILRVWVGGWRRFNGYNPTRLYYQFRNFIFLFRLSFIPFLWKVRFLWYVLGNFYAHAVFAQNRSQSLKAMVSGVWDGLRGRMGNRHLNICNHFHGNGQ